MKFTIPPASGNKACHPGGHYWNYYHGALSQIKSLQLIWRSGTHRWNLWVPDLQMSCRDLITHMLRLGHAREGRAGRGREELAEGGRSWPREGGAGRGREELAEGWRSWPREEAAGRGKEERAKTPLASTTRLVAPALAARRHASLLTSHQNTLYYSLLNVTTHAPASNYNGWPPEAHYNVIHIFSDTHKYVLILIAIEKRVQSRVLNIKD